VGDPLPERRAVDEREGGDGVARIDELALEAAGAGTEMVVAHPRVDALAGILVPVDS
jgi:hypothetical protein